MVKKEKKEKDLWKIYLRVLAYSSRRKGLFFASLFFTFLGVGFKLTIPLVFGAFFNQIQKALTGTETITGDLIMLSVLFFAIHILDGISNAYGDYIIGKWWMVTENDVFKELYQHITKLSVDFYEKNPTGKIRERVWDGAQAIVNILEKTFLTILPQTLFIIFAIIILTAIKPLFGLIVLSIVPLYFWVSYHYFKKLKVIQEDNRKKWEALSTYVTESIFNAKTIKTYSTEEYHINKIEDHCDAAVDNEIAWQSTNAWLRGYRSLILNIVKVVTITLGFFMIANGELLLGTFIIIWNYVTQSLDPINNMARSIDNIQKLLVGTGLTLEYMDEKPSVEDSKNAKNIKLKEAEIVFENISFKYNNKPVITNLSLKVPKGKVVAIVGKSGSGKSTLVKLLLRFYDPQKGKVLINGIDIKNITQHSLRTNIAAVMQDSVLFNDTVENNILYSSGKSKRSDVIAAAKISSSFDFISNMPKKFKTIVGEKGVKLSGGEQQRINIARAVLKKSPIVIFDEATSSLDSESEQAIQEAMWKVIDGKTTIIIAHRLATIMRADMIVVMNKGRITEVGTHSELVEKKGIYSKLFDIQSGAFLLEDDKPDSKLENKESKKEVLV